MSGVFPLSWFLVICCFTGKCVHYCLSPNSFQPSTTAAVFDESRHPPQSRNRSFSHTHHTVGEQYQLLCSYYWLKTQSKNHFVFRGVMIRFLFEADTIWKRSRHLCGRLQLPRMDLQSYRAGECWQCSTWSLLSLLWQRTGPDHWRWWGGLAESDKTRERDKEDKVRKEDYDSKSKGLRGTVASNLWTSWWLP